ncbi:MAG TPA: hydroxymethylbilane synthase [Vicinamibacterales bacterium]|nr:hydroxymethylbilane synthase [Vicinamibacterales bacterium]
MTDRLLKIGSRGSRLALWQATTVKDRLQATGARADIVVIRTTGDRSQTSPVAGDETKRQFVKEIEDALLDRSVDVAVHSAKDMTIVLPDGLALAACLPREDPLDAIVLPGGDGPIGWAAAISRLGALPRAAVIGTGSVRRTAQLASALPGAAFTPIRGNVDTRLSKLDAGGFDALILACAGLRRLGFAGRISAAVPLEQCVPAPGQGIVAMEIRADDDEARRAVARIHDDAAGRALAAEWAVVAALGGGCQLPLGAIAVHEPATAELELTAIVASRDGAQTIRRARRGPAAGAAALGKRIATELQKAGALALLNEVG